MKLKRRRLEQVAILPTLLTLGNLLCGFGALVFTVKGEFASAAWLIILAMAVFDALDGQIARRVAGGETKFGAQLDSLSDIVSFGAAPAFMAYEMINRGGYQLISYKFTFLLCAFYLVCVALRLARFNVETTIELPSHQYFSGLPSPGAAGMLAGLVILHQSYSKEVTKVITVGLPFMTLLLAILMVTRLRYIHLLNMITRAKYPFIRLVGILLAILLVALKPEETLCAGFFIYVLSGPITYARSRLFPRTRLATITTESRPNIATKQNLPTGRQK